MASLTSRKYKGKLSWYIVDSKTINGVRSKTTTALGQITKTEAKKLLAAYELTNNRRKNHLTITFKNAYLEFIEDYKKQIDVFITKRTHDLTVYHISIVSKKIQNTLLNKIDYEYLKDIQLWLSEKGHSNRYVNTIMSDIIKVLKFCLDKQYIFSLPSVKRLNQAKLDEVKYLTPKQLKIAFSEMPEYWAFYYKVIFWSGMRPKEARNLKWDDINMRNKTIKIHPIAFNKSGRVIPIVNELYTLLNKYWKKYDDDYIGLFRSKHTGVRFLGRLSKKLGFTVSERMFRASFASYWASKKLTTTALRSLMGHSNIQTTMKHYIGLRNEQLLEMMNDAKNDELKYTDLI